MILSDNIIIQSLVIEFTEQDLLARKFITENKLKLLLRWKALNKCRTCYFDEINYLICFQCNLCSKLIVVVVLLCLFALGQSVHVVLTHRNSIFVLLQATEEILAEVKARMLLCSCHLLLGLITVFLLSISCLSSLSSFSWGLTMSRTSTHHGSNTLMSNLATGSESHASCHSAHETTASKSHSTALLLLWCCLLPWLR